ncbi:MAG: hypothetical protein HYZ69_02665, partial [Candidatus Colwellbacteria bacterium]|nr:hypothetical protein [Candidatus Colwellbacteria bacterium]
MTTHKNVEVGITAIIGIAVLFYPSAIIVRQYVIPFYVNTFYRKSVDREFAKSFNAFNSELNSLGLTQYRSSGFDPATVSATCYNHVTDNGQNGYYEGISETVPCIKQVNLDPFVPDDEFIATWRAGAHKLTASLQTNGWTMSGSLVAGSDNSTDAQVITKIFDVPNRSPADQYAAKISYSKTIGKTK